MAAFDLLSGAPPPESIGVSENMKPAGTGASPADPASSQSPQEKLVRQLYQMRDPKAPDGETLQRALDIISVQLNSNSNHFLLELLQNADDCRYPAAVVPTLSASMTSGPPNSLVIHCNETGFSAEDVKGICGIGDSTKEESVTTTGEKGIGFKSVFRLADVVWIASNGFTFKLDKTKSLGLIRPIWDPNFPLPQAEHGTLMLLTFPDRSDDGDLDTHSHTPFFQAFFAMLHFDDRHMLFLRQMRKVEFDLHSGPRVFTRHDLDDEVNLSETVTSRRVIITCEESGGGGTETISNRSYIVLKRHVVGLSQRSSKRPSVQSDIELAFPVNKEFAAAESTYQHLYAFLPVKKTRFRFLIHADLVLAASREEIQESSRWNAGLRDAIPDVFTAAVHEFNSSSGLRYTWPLYLSPADEICPFFQPMWEDLLAKLKASPIMETENGWGDMAPPERLVFVPEKYRYTPSAEDSQTPKSEQDPHGGNAENQAASGSSRPGKQSPLIPSRRGKGTYLSLSYSAECKPSLELLGVREMDSLQLLDDFSRFVNDEHATFAAQPCTWHDRIAKALLDGNFHSECRDKLKRLKMVPLADSAVAWAEVGAEPEPALFFSDGALDIPALPRGIGLRRISHAVQQGTQRFGLLEKLGAKLPSKEKELIHRLVEDWHRVRTLPEGATDEDLVSHVVFLFKTNYRRRRTSTLSEPVDIFVATTSGTHRLSSETHFDAFPEFDGQAPIAVLSPRYWEAVEVTERRALREWMAEQLGVWSYPRLYDAEFVLSPELTKIRDSDPYKFLAILRSYWHRYKGLLDKQDASTGVARLYLKWKIQLTELVCQNRETTPLEQTILPDADVRQMVGIAPFPLLALPADEYESWKFLEDLGVKLGLRVHHWMQCLTELSNMKGVDNSTSTTVELRQVAAVYSRLQKLANESPENFDQVRNDLGSKNLIFIPSDCNPKGHPMWVSAERCIWQNYETVKLMRHFSLVKAYADFDLRGLFVGTIGVCVSPDFSHLVEEARHMGDIPDTRENLKRVINLCDELSFQLEHANRYFPEPKTGREHEGPRDAGYYLKQLLDIDVFPVWPAVSRLWSSSIYMLSASDQEWYVADRDHFHQSFEGRLNLLRLDVQQLERCRTLLYRLNCQTRFLSEAVEMTTDAMAGEDAPELCQDLAMRLRARARYIESLRPIAFANMKGRRVPHIADIRAYSVKTVCVTWRVGDVTSKPDSRRVVATRSGSALCIYVQRSDLESPRPPVELAEELAFFFDIPRERTHLLQFILTDDSLDDIEDTLRKAGISIIPEREASWEQGPKEAPITQVEPSPNPDRGHENEKDDDGQKESLEPHEPVPTAEISPSPEQTTSDGADEDDNPSAGSDSEQSQTLLPPSHDKSARAWTPPIDRPRSPEHMQQLRTKEAVASFFREMSLRADTGEKAAGKEPAEMASGRQKRHLRQGKTDAVTRPRENKKGTEEETDRHKLDQAMAQVERERRFKRRGETAGSLFGQLIQASPVFRSSGPTNVYYVSDRAQMPLRDAHEWPKGTLAVLESSTRVFVDSSKNREVFALLPTISDPHDVEDDFLGQAWVSQWLRNHLGSAYDPDTDWRSSYRAKLGYTKQLKHRHSPEINSETPFRVTDEAGALAKFLAGMDYRPARKWTRHRVEYYIDVKTTRSHDENPEFSIELSRFDKIREYRIQAGVKTPAYVFIFVAISNIDSETAPRAAFYVDPWATVANGNAALRITGNKLLFIRFDQRSDARVLDPTYQPPAMTTGWVSRVLSSMNRVMSTSRQLEQGPGAGQASVTKRTSPIIRTAIYKWEPLPQPGSTIRLLRLYSGSGELHGTLVSFPLHSHDRPAYTALSYTWGSGLKMFSLYMGREDEDESIGQSRAGPRQVIPITVSLYLALRKMRPRPGEGDFVHVWADAVCIAQTPIRGDAERDGEYKRREDRQLREKAEQIQLLAGIFSSAEMVLAWLGDEEEGDDSRAAIERLDRLGGQLQEFMEAPGRGPLETLRRLREDKDVALVNEFDLPDKEHRDWAAIGSLISRRWFSRIWIVQEVLLASKLGIRCGDSTMAWDRFYLAVHLCLLVADLNGFSIADSTVHKNIEELGRRRNDCWKGGRLDIKGDIFELVQAFHQKGATVPRDRLFALLSMATDESRRGLEPDYTLSLPALVRNWGWALVKLGRCFDLLYLARLSWRHEYDSEDKADQVPSWLPHLTAPQFPETISQWTGTFQAGTGTGAAAGAESASLPAVQGGELSLYGYVVDTIAELDPSNVGSISGDPRPYLRGIFALIDGKAAEGKLTKAEAEDIKCRVPIGDADRPATGHWHRYNRKVTRLAAYRHVSRYLYVAREGSDLDSSESWKDEEHRLRAAGEGGAVQPSLEQSADCITAYISTALKFADKLYPAHAVVCWTEGNRVGLVPHVAEEGDIVVVFPEAKVPFVLRKKTDRAYVLVGEAYLHGIMRGEAMRMVGLGEMGRRIHLV